MKIHHWSDGLPELIFAQFKEMPISYDWFKAYQITDSLFVFHEPRHFEKTLMSLVIGADKAILIDTGCGIGDLRKTVEEITEKPVTVVNTHTHTDHIGSNHQFEDVAMFDHPLSHKISEIGVSHDVMAQEILDDKLVVQPLPDSFDVKNFSLPPFKVNKWLNHGDVLDLGDRELLAIHTPGEALDHICLLDSKERVLFCGDILVHGSIWTHLSDGSLKSLIKSYENLMEYYGFFDYLMPSHNEPWIKKSLIPECLKAAKKIESGEAEYQEIKDIWGRSIKQYCFRKFDILT